MRSLRIILGLAVAVCVFGATALPAFAEPPEFKSSGGPLKGKAEGEQEFKFGVFKITCTAAKITGGEHTPLESKTLAVSVRYKGCTTAGKIGGNEIKLTTKFKTPFDLEYKVNGLVQKIGGEGELEGEGNLIVKGGSIELKIPSIKCTLNILEQSVPFKPGKKTEFETAEFAEEPLEKGKNTFERILITNEFKGLHFEYEGGQCEQFKGSEEEQKKGTYHGEMLVEIAHGQLGFVA